MDPLKDINASREAVRLGITSPQMVAAQNGVDVEDVLTSIAAFEAMCKAKGVTLVDYRGDRQGAAKPGPQDNAQEAEHSKESQA